MEMDIIKLVSELKRTYDTANPFVIAEKLGIEIRYVSFLDNPKGKFQELLGSPIILLNNSLKESEERFYICAHELGHALFHREISSYYVSSRNSRSKSESEANCFASNLIVSLYFKCCLTYFYKFKSVMKTEIVTKHLFLLIIHFIILSNCSINSFYNS
ncbi:ImmA/IrrE family metallo-endopeptidase [Enterococcus mundtii]|nr:ImmA/IrrE family metallo-endopeptidase [Enterococcus mundtii]MDB7088544.1 ImmA/IrrE family metallo-endopeptidase [Enterococcus mundtii]